MKIVHLIATNFVGGPEKQILEHGLRLKAEPDIDFCLVSFLEGERQNELLVKAAELGLATRPLKTGSPFNPKAIRDLVKILEDVPCDLLVTHGYKANIVGRFASWFLGLPQMAISRGWTAENWKIRIYEKLDRLFLRAMAHVVAVSEGQREKLLKAGVRREKTTVIHNAIDLARTRAAHNSLREELGVEEDVPLVVGAGRLSPEKNFRGFIEVAHHVLKQEPKAVFAIFGEGVLRADLERQIEGFGLKDRILLPGFRRDFVSLISASDIFFQSSFTEGLPNVVLEAFAAKLPVVATDVGGTGEVVQDGMNGFLVQSDDIEGMVNRLLELLRDPQLRRDMGQAGYEYVEKHFDFNHQTLLYQKLYSHLVIPDSVEGRHNYSDDPIL